eukprot:scpid59285/ scgid3310/ 
MSPITDQLPAFQSCGSYSPAFWAIRPQPILRLHLCCLMSRTENGCKRGTYGTKDQLVIDLAAMADSKRRRTNLAMAWVDYKKAYDMVPHDWIERCLELFGIHESVRRLMTVSMAQWKVDR